MTLLVRKRGVQVSVSAARRRQSSATSGRPSLLTILLWLVVIASVFPMYWMILTALKQPGDVQSYPPQFFPIHMNLSGSTEVFATGDLGRWLLNSMLVSVLSTVLALILASFSAYALARLRFRGRRLVGLSVLVTQMLPGTLFLIPLYQVFLQFGLIDSLWSLVIANTTFALPVAIWLLMGFFEGIPRELTEAARIDGCSQTQVFLKVIVPLARSGFIVAAIFSFINSWNEFLFARTFINDASKYTVSVGLSTYIGQYTVSWNQIMAAATFGTLPVLVAFFLMQRHLVVGLTAGAVKG